jgi:hypothetical protein
MHAAPTPQPSAFETSETLGDAADIQCNQAPINILRAPPQLRHDAPNPRSFFDNSRPISCNGLTTPADVQKPVTYSFRTGQALPLVFTRFLRPCTRRGEYAKHPRDIPCRCAETRQIRELKQSTIGMRTRSIRVRERSMSAFSPKPQAWSQPARVREWITVCSVRRQAVTKDTACPQTRHNLELSASPNSAWTRTFREPRVAKNCPCRRILVSISSLTRFPVRIPITPYYALI